MNQFAADMLSGKAFSNNYREDGHENSNVGIFYSDCMDPRRTDTLTSGMEMLTETLRELVFDVLKFSSVPRSNADGFGDPVVTRTIQLFEAHEQTFPPGSGEGVYEYWLVSLNANLSLDVLDEVQKFSFKSLRETVDYFGHMFAHAFGEAGLTVKPGHIATMLVRHVSTTEFPNYRSSVIFFQRLFELISVMFRLIRVGNL